MAKYSKLSRLYLEQKLASNIILTIEDEKFKYFSTVLRLKVGQKVRLFNQIDGEFEAVIIDVQKRSLNLQIGNELSKNISLRPLTLAICVIKGDKFQQAIRAAVQLGITNFVPLISEYTQISSLNYERIERSIIDATEQCERIDIATISEMQNLENYLENSRSQTILWANEGAGRDENIMNVANIESTNILLVGPEGGFSQREVELLNNYKNVNSVWLSDLVLRTEIAIIAGLSAIQLMRNK